ncbi:glutathione S-transferase 1-1-like [Drosophila sulfurigaster albostrigata]|uniref:glutathione S-transferase 1-1-like n=1 Tax=Drosophila sulfurigaster albostrigata TaxID=89887 RepID=UPI002D21A759|nr:glutathione S-transferase 1-1-like [Drosophila sulfurigaster albostrigata]XP_062125935.1 glutathione S-transferase 1-1-like [Drosophila sulfurigaster albostrigata]
MDLYYSPYSASTGALLLLGKALGLEFNKIEVSVAAKEHLKPEFVKINPQHTIPTIVDKGYVLWESRAILTYLIEQYGKDDSLYPKDPKKRGVINQRLYFDVATLYPALADYYHPQFYKKPLDPELFKKVEEVLNFLENFLDGKKYLAGDSLSVADISILSTIASFQGIGLDIGKYKNIARWYENGSKVAPGWDEVEKSAAALKAILKSLQ